MKPSNLYGNKKASLKIRGLEDMLSKIEAVGNSVDKVVMEAVEQSTKPIYDDVKAWSEEHKLTGETSREVIKPKAEMSGNLITSDFGVSGKGESWHAVFVEYGRPGAKADPGVRRAVETNKRKVKEIQCDVLKKGGMPIE